MSGGGDGGSLVACHVKTILRINDKSPYWGGVIIGKHLLDSIPWKNGGVCERRVELDKVFIKKSKKQVTHWKSFWYFFSQLFLNPYLGEVEHDINENEGDAENKDPEDQVQSKEPGKGNADLIAKHNNWRKIIFYKYVLNRNKLWEKTS